MPQNTPQQPRPADPRGRGHYRLCGRCKGTGEARYNHLNGDTHCYLCNGLGWQLVYTAAEKAAIEAEQLWYTTAYYQGYHLRLTVERTARKAEQARRGYVYHRLTSPVDPQAEATRRLARRTARLATFWVHEGLENMNAEGGTQ